MQLNSRDKRPVHTHTSRKRHAHVNTSVARTDSDAIGLLSPTLKPANEVAACLVLEELEVFDSRLSDPASHLSHSGSGAMLKWSAVPCLSAIMSPF